MRYRLLWIGLMLFVAMPALAKQPILNIQRWETSSGAQVYFVRRPEIPMVDIQFVFAAGSAHDGQQWGVAHLVNTLLNQGTKQHDASEIAAGFDAVGARFGASVNRDMALVSLRSVTDAQYLKPALVLFESLLTQPHFSKQAFLRVKKQTEAGIRSSQQDPMSVASNAFYQALYGSLPYAHPVMGTVKTVGSLTQEQVLQFYQQYYVAKNADLIIVGDLTPSKARRLAEQLTQHLPAGEQARAPLLASNNVFSQKQIVFPAKQQSIILGQVSAARQNVDYFPLMVGNQILGGGTMTSILFNKVRNDRGLVYGVTSRFSFLEARGPFSIVLQTRSEKSAEALNVTRKVLNEFIHNGPSEEQLRAAERSILGRFPLQIAKNSQIESILTQMAFYHLPLNYLDTYCDKVRAVSSKQIQHAFAQWLNPKSMVIIMVGPRS